jgi:hypothetical protein
MDKNIKDSEKEELLLLCLSEAIKRFSYPDEDFFDGENRAKLVVGGKLKSTQLNGLLQMALNAKDIDEICKVILQKVSRATLPEWHIEVINTLEGPTSRDRVEIWEFLVRALIHIRDFKYRSCRFLDVWLGDHIAKVNEALTDNGFDEHIDPEDIELSNKQRLELARSFIHRFVTIILVERKIRGVK